MSQATPAFAGRVIRALGRQAVAGDPSKLAELAKLSATISETVDATVRQMHDNGMSWTVIGDALGMTRQGAWQRWGGE